MSNGSPASRIDGDTDLAQLSARIPGVVYLFDVEQHRNAYVTRYIATALGYDERIVLDEGFLREVLHPDDAAPWGAHVASFDQLGDDDTRTISLRFRHADGSWRWYENRDAVFSRRADGRVWQLIGVAVDVTARHDVEEALRRRITRAAARNDLADALRSLHSVSDIRAATADLLLRELHVASVDFGDVDEDAHGVQRTVHSASRPVSHQGHHRLDSYGPVLLARLRAGETVVVHDVTTDPALGPDDVIALQGMGIASFVLVPMLRLGRPVALMSVHHDNRYEWQADDVMLAVDSAEWARSAGERAGSELALREREDRYRELFTAIDEGFCLCELIVDDDGQAVDYRFLEVNRRFEEQSGLTDPVGRTALELVPDLETHWFATYAEVALHGRALRFERRSDVMDRWFDIYAVPVGAPDARQFALVFNDITARKRAEQALQDSETSERRARHKAEFLSELSGELEGTPGAQGQIDRLVALLVPRIADYATVEIPGSRPLVGVSHRQQGQLHSRMTMSLDIGNNAKGCLLLGLRDESRRPFEDVDRAFVRQIADRAALVLASSLLRDEEHRIALRLQQALLPDELLSRPGVALAARYEASGDVLEVGGDWYDTFTLADGRLGLSVGDVVGHGLEAAASMGRLRTALNALASQASQPGQLLTMLDQFSCGPNGAAFATACCAILDPATGLLGYASAGHPPMLVMSVNGQARWLWDGRSRPLSGQPVADRASATTQLDPGDVLLLFSDGLVEQRGHLLGEGLARLEQTVRDNREAPVDILADRIIADLYTGTAVADDVVILGLRLSSDLPQRLSLVVPADPAELGGVRAAIRNWSTAQGLDATVTRHLLVAVGEAVSNSIEHAYLARSTGTVELDVCRTPSALLVRVADHGQWSPAAVDVDSRGRGTDIITTLSTGFVRHTGRRGTIALFSVPTTDRR